MLSEYFKGKIRTHSSRVTRFKVGAAAAMTLFPVAADPVKEILAIPGCLVIHGPRFSSPPRACTTPGGKKSCASSATLRILYGVYGEGLTITVFPQISDDATLPRARKTGKFQGTIAPTTPSGKYFVVTLTFSSSCVVYSGISMFAKSNLVKASFSDSNYHTNSSKPFTS